MPKNNNTVLKRNSILAYTREELNETLERRLAIKKFKSNSNHWQQVVDSIHNDDHAWSYMEDAIDNAVNTLVDEIQTELSSQ